MKVQPIKENTRDYIAAGTLGAIGGYTVKNLLPLSEYEREEFFTPDIMRSIKGAERSAREAEYDSIIVGAKEGSEEIAENVLDIFKANKDNVVGNRFRELLENIKIYDDKIQESVIKLSKRVRDIGKDARKAESQPIEALAKSSRPTSYFILFGSIIFLSLAVLRNSLRKNMNTENDNKKLDKIA